MLVGHYFTKHYRGHFYAKAQNLNRKLRAAYDAALGNYDLLLMPTLPMKATPLPAPDAPRELYIQRAFEMVPNTAPFNASGHPAMTIPCGMSDGLPIGLMLIGKYHDESVIIRSGARLSLDSPACVRCRSSGFRLVRSRRGVWRRQFREQRLQQRSVDMPSSD
jgi:amidase